jgi:hypothetical protein
MNTFFRLYLCLILLISIFVTDQAIVKKANAAVSSKVDHKKDRKHKHDSAATALNVMTALYSDLKMNGERVVTGVNIVYDKTIACKVKYCVTQLKKLGSKIIGGGKKVNEADENYASLTRVIRGLA